MNIWLERWVSNDALNLRILLETESKHAINQYQIVGKTCQGY